VSLITADAAEPLDAAFAAPAEATNVRQIAR
jgi:hypothetical protein